MKKLIIISIACLFFSGAFAQEDISDNYKNEFGGHAGAVTGVGFSYRHWGDNRLGFQVTGIPVKMDGDFWASVGFTGLYTLKKTKYVRTFLYFGNHVLFQEEYVQDPYYYSSDEKEMTTQYNLGFGPGFSFGRIVAFNLMFGYGIYDIGGEFNMFPTGEIGVYYMF